MVLVIVLICILFCEKQVLILYKKHWDDDLEARVLFEDEYVTEGESGYISEQISNGKLLPIPVISVKFELNKSIHYAEKLNIVVSDRQYRNDTLSLYPYKQINRRFKVTYTKRGVYSIDSLLLNTKDILSTTFMSKQYKEEALIYVYPTYSSYKDVIAPFSRVVGEALRNKFLFEDPFEFKGIRDYTGTEPMKKINWSASAKTGNLMVNNYYDTSSRYVSVFLDIVNANIWKRDDQVEECIRITRNYLEGFVKNHVPVKLITNGRDCFDGRPIVMETGTSAGVVEACLKKLARIDISSETDPMASYFMENQAEDGELSILLSVDTSSELTRAYEKYLGKNDGEWIAPILVGAQRSIHSRNIHVTYVEVSR